MSIRKFIQSKLNELSIEVGTELPDEMLELNKVYFSYLVMLNAQDKDFDNNFSYDVNVVGYIKLKSSLDIDDLELIDNAQKEIEEKFKEMNFIVSFNDVSIIDSIRKIQVNANATYNEINNKLT